MFEAQKNKSSTMYIVIILFLKTSVLKESLLSPPSLQYSVDHIHLMYGILGCYYSIMVWHANTHSVEQWNVVKQKWKHKCPRS